MFICLALSFRERRCLRTPSIKRQAQRGGGQLLPSALYLYRFCFLKPFLSAPLSLAWSLTPGGPLRTGRRNRWGGEYGLGSVPDGSCHPARLVLTLHGLQRRCPAPHGRGRAGISRLRWSKALLRRGSQACSLGERDREGPASRPEEILHLRSDPPCSFFLSALSSPLSASQGPQNSRMFLEFKTYHQGFIKDF